MRYQGSTTTISAPESADCLRTAHKSPNTRLVKLTLYLSFPETALRHPEGPAHAVRGFLVVALRMAA